MVKPIWTAAEDAMLEKLWLKGYTLSKIAMNIELIFNRECSRSAVNGRINRIDALRKQRGEPPMHGSQPRRLYAPPVYCTIDLQGFPISYSNGRSAPLRRLSKLPLSPSLQITMMEAFKLEDDHGHAWCRFPTHGLKFCGHPVFQGGNYSERPPYCPHHQEVAHRGLVDVSPIIEEFINKDEMDICVSEDNIVDVLDVDGVDMDALEELVKDYG